MRDEPVIEDMAVRAIQERMGNIPRGNAKSNRRWRRKHANRCLKEARH
jgi:hypothetical protein